MEIDEVKITKLKFIHHRIPIWNFTTNHKQQTTNH